MLKMNLKNISVRVLAKVIDWSIYAILLELIFIITDTDFNLFDGGSAALIFATIWVGIEAVLLLTLRTTPGRAFFGVKLVSSNGSPLGSLGVLFRSALFLVIGMALGYPFFIVVAWIVNLIIMLVKGKTLYDWIGGFEVQVAEVRKWRVVLIAVLLFIALVGITISDFSSGNAIIIN